MQQLNTKETKEISGGFVVAIPLVAGGLWEILTGAAALTGLITLQKVLNKDERTPPAPVINPVPPKKDKDKPDIQHWDNPNKKEKDKK